MKTRSGFVSNSSSSSFCILGVQVDENPENKFSYTEIKESGLTYEYGMDHYYNQNFLGFYPEEMKEDETLSEFKDRILEALNKLGVQTEKKKINWYADGGYDG